MTLKRQLYFWLGSFAAFSAFVYVFSPILLPFVAGMALAYLLDPVADWLERRGLPRLAATIAILAVFVVMFMLILLLLLPVLGNQLSAFLSELPKLVGALQKLMTENIGQRAFEVLGISGADLKSSVGGLLGEGAGWIAGVAKSLWNGGQALLSVLSLFVVTPVVAFYLLLDWDHMVERVDGWLPRQHRDKVERLAKEMDTAVAGFLRGQLSVCVLLGAFYAIGLAAVGLNFGLLIGIGAGLVSFIPYVGATLGLVVSLGVALVQFWPDWVMIGAVLVVFAVGQFLEGNVLQPKLVGKTVGLHPVWLMFALFAFGYLFGFVGMLIAVPAAAMIGVLARFVLSQYMASSLYSGTGGSRAGDRDG
ncbi:AI-2E family transporter [Stappia sp. ES.058]|uniref:AI-2E family transporter n=1 Tax=Stappia sp. ES.058 TaxID=1881061 RepID=UPI00087DD647|nr:AI-2E family transporter [Stappia sp. ES.058]SDU13224.1 Predicted PurR-regulated permease PerM [Stappia sp. ES.058]